MTGLLSREEVLRKGQGEEVLNRGRGCKSVDDKRKRDTQIVLCDLDSQKDQGGG